MMNSLTEAFDYLKNQISSIDRFNSAYVKPENNTSMSDKFGTIEFKSSGSVFTTSTVLSSFIINPKARLAYIDCLPNRGTYVCLRNGENNVVYITTGVANFFKINLYGEIAYGSLSFAPHTLILPVRFYGSTSFKADTFSFCRGLYLNRYGTNFIGSEGWIVDSEHIDAAYEFAPAIVDFDSGYNMSPMYLNRLYLSTKTFENLASKLGTVTDGKLYLGTKNTDRMTTAQKDAITAKGWTIY